MISLLLRLFRIRWEEFVEDKGINEISTHLADNYVRLTWRVIVFWHEF